MTTSGDATIRIWSVKDGSCLRTMPGHGASVLRALFSHVGTRIISAGSDGLVKVWSLATGECQGTIEAHDDKIWALDVGGDDGEFLISGGGDGSLVLWADCTQVDAEQARHEEETRLHAQQVGSFFCKISAMLAFHVHVTLVCSAFRKRSTQLLPSV
jgi:U3 small nucleolar RNA-associated protein 13